MSPGNGNLDDAEGDEEIKGCLFMDRSWTLANRIMLYFHAFLCTEFFYLLRLFFI